MSELFHCLLEVETQVEIFFVSLEKYTIVLNLHWREGEGGSYSNILQLEPGSHLHC